MDDRNDESTKCKFVLIMLFHMLILFVDGRRVKFMKNKELLVHEGTVKTIEVIIFYCMHELNSSFSIFLLCWFKVMHFESFKSY